MKKEYEFKNNLKELKINYEIPMNLSEYKVVDGELVEKEIEIIEKPTAPSNVELQNEIEELKGVIDIMLGGIDGGI